MNEDLFLKLQKNIHERLSITWDATIATIPTFYLIVMET